MSLDSFHRGHLHVLIPLAACQTSDSIGDIVLVIL